MPASSALPPGALGVVTMAENGGGIGYVARLLEHSLLEIVGAHPRVIALDPARFGLVSAVERARFSAALSLAQLRRDVRWVLFNHAGVARAQLGVPAPVRRPYGVFLHDVEAWAPDLPASRVNVMRRATVRLSNSHYTARRVAAAHPTVGAVVACPLGLMPHDGRGTADETLLRSVPPRSVLITGRMHDTERYKGHDELIEAWPSIVARAPGAVLLVAGGGNDVERLREKAGALAGDAIRFLGYLDPATLRALYGRVALFAMPSAREGFGLVYLEAMRAGVACVASTADAAGDVVLDGLTGLLVDRESRESLADAIASLLLDEARCRRMGDEGRRRFEAEFTADRFTARLREVMLAAFAGPHADLRGGAGS